MTAGPSTETGAAPGSGGASFYALGPEFEWLASAWDGFARDLAETGGTLRHIVSVAAADPALAAESSGLAALESATDRLVRELVDDAARLRRTLATYEQADAAVRASVPGMPAIPVPPQPVPPVPVPQQGLWTPEPAGPDTGSGSGYAGSDAGSAFTSSPPATAPPTTESTMFGALSRVRRDILARAEHWTDQHIPYSQTSWHEGYRTDCSGYVSMCWGLRDSMVTSTMPQIAHPIAKDQLKAGDVLLNTDVATGHVVLFDRWADYAHSTYVGFELCPSGTLHHVIPYPYYEGFGTFEPYRYNNAGD